MGEYRLKRRQAHHALEKYDWNGARTDYIEGIVEEGVLRYPKNAEICEKYNIPKQSLANKIHKERWNDHKKANERQRMVAIQKERTKKLASRAVILDESAADAAQIGIKLILERLMEIDQVRSHDKQRIAVLLEMYENGEIIDEDQFKKDIRPWMWHEEISELAKAFEKFHEAGRRALGIRDEESGVTQNNNIHVEITQTNLSEELNRDDEHRNALLRQVLQNKNLVIPGLTDVVEGEVVDEPLEITVGAENE